MGAELGGGRREFRARALLAEFGIGDVAGMAVGVAEVLAGRGRRLSSSSGWSSPIQSRPLSVNQNSPEAGFQSNPTLPAHPLATTCRSEPSGRIFMILA